MLLAYFFDPPDWKVDCGKSASTASTRILISSIMVSAQDVDRIFLQAVLSRGILSAELAKVLWEKSVSIVNSKKALFLFGNALH